MEFRRRSLWNRVWDGEALDLMGHEEYVRRVYEGEGYNRSDRWREIGYGLVLSAWKGVQWVWNGLPLRRWWRREEHEKHEKREKQEEHEDTIYEEYQEQV